MIKGKLPGIERSSHLIHTQLRRDGKYDPFSWPFYTSGYVDVLDWNFKVKDIAWSDRLNRKLAYAYHPNPLLPISTFFEMH